MTLQPDRAKQFSIQIVEAQGTGSMPEKKRLRSEIVTKVICVGWIADREQEFERTSIVGAGRSIIAIRHKQPLRLWHIQNALRPLEPLDRIDNLARLYIQNLNRIISERGHEKPLALEVNRHMIDAA